jgi:hypothetical protein
MPWRPPRLGRSRCRPRLGGGSICPLKAGHPRRSAACRSPCVMTGPRRSAAFGMPSTRSPGIVVLAMLVRYSLRWSFANVLWRPGLLPGICCAGDLQRRPMKAHRGASSMPARWIGRGMSVSSQFFLPHQAMRLSNDEFDFLAFPVCRDSGSSRLRDAWLRDIPRRYTRAG